MSTKDNRKSCRFRGCGRLVRAAGLCQTHYKQQREGKPLRPIQPKRPKRENTMRYSGLSLTVFCAQTIERRARREKRAPNSVITDILEEWARKQRARKQK